MMTKQMSIAFAASALVLAAGQAARADITVVSEVNMTGQPQRQGPGSRPGPAFPHTVTAYYQGAKTRTETTGGQVAIYDSAAGKIYRLDPDQKVYFVTSMAPGAQGPMGGRPLPKTTLTLTPGTGKQTLAGKSAKKYALAGSVTMTGQGGPPPGGGFGGGGFGGGGGQRGGRPPGPQNVTVAGEVWLSDSVKLPAEASEVSIAEEALGMARPLVSPFTELLDKTRAIPMLSRITVTPEAPPSSPNGQNDNPPPAPAPSVVTVTVKSISTTALAETLFSVPSDYTEVAPPQRGPGGRPGRGPGMGGPPPDGGPGMGGPGMDGGPNMGGPPPPGMGMDGPPPPDGM